MAALFAIHPLHVESVAWVDALSLGLFARYQQYVSENLSLTWGVRLQRNEYDYDNRMIDGNTREDGSACGFGGCLYSRPADRKDSFTNLAPNLAFRYRLADRA